MPILYIHGVNTRSRKPFEEEVQVYLRRYVAPAISTTPNEVWIEDVYWGDLGVQLAWHGASRPKSRLLGAGANDSPDVSRVEQALMANLLSTKLSRWEAGQSGRGSSGGLLGGATPTTTTIPDVRLDKLSPDELSEVLCGIINSKVTDPKDRVVWLIAADEAAQDEQLLVQIKQETDPARQVNLLLSDIQRRYRDHQTLLGQGVGEWFASIADGTRETFGRATSFPAYTASVFAAEVRKPLNELISIFIGDVFQYLTLRGTDTSPGAIPARLIEKLISANRNKRERNGEPLVVLSHSMGGQIVYDAVSAYLPRSSELAGIKIEFWCATASQVGFFEEAKMFLASSNENVPGHPVLFPHRHLGVWWNVWDHNDFLSFTATDIFSGVDDESFESGMSLLGAHGGYLQRPTFYRHLAAKLLSAKRRGWRTV